MLRETGVSCRAFTGNFREGALLNVLISAMRRGNCFNAERQCCEIRLHAERRAGELLQHMEKAKGARSSVSRLRMRASMAAAQRRVDFLNSLRKATQIA